MNSKVLLKFWQRIIDQKKRWTFSDIQFNTCRCQNVPQLHVSMFFSVLVIFNISALFRSKKKQLRNISFSSFTIIVATHDAINQQNLTSSFKWILHFSFCTVDHCYMDNVLMAWKIYRSYQLENHLAILSIKSILSWI